MNTIQKRRLHETDIERQRQQAPLTGQSHNPVIPDCTVCTNSPSFGFKQDLKSREISHSLHTSSTATNACIDPPSVFHYNSTELEGCKGRCITYFQSSIYPHPEVHHDMTHYCADFWILLELSTRLNCATLQKSHTGEHQIMAI